MDSRRRLVSLIESGRSVSSVAREFGVSRQTAYLWLRRSDDEGIERMSVRSRRPLHCPSRCPDEVAAVILAASDAHPYWGARKLRALLWPDGDAPVCERTVGRVLSRAGRVVAERPGVQPADLRFEREESNQLWQVDFKRLGPRQNRVETINILDDASRFCLASRIVSDQTLDSAWTVLWDAFGEYGMPQAILSDNGPAFHCNTTWRWSKFDLRLMLLGIRPVHGRPYHPQTQGKVERFHGTLEREVGRRFAGPEDLKEFRDRYNWLRPHEALDLKTPGSRYAVSSKARPQQMPEPFFPPGAQWRQCDDLGKFSFQGQRYRAGIAFQRQRVGILIPAEGIPYLVWADQLLAPLNDLKV